MASILIWLGKSEILEFLAFNKIINFFFSQFESLAYMPICRNWGSNPGRADDSRPLYRLSCRAILNLQLRICTIKLCTHYML